MGKVLMLGARGALESKVSGYQGYFLQEMVTMSTLE